MRIRNPDLLTQLHLRWRECVLCGRTSPLSLHHISNKPRHDVEANLVMLCGSGTTGCHGKIEAHDTFERWQLAIYIREHRLDTMSWLTSQYFHEKADAWLKRVYGA